MFIIQMIGAICVAFLIAWAIVAYKEMLRCNREDGGYPCHGDNCEGCYRMIGGRVEYEYPQPMNQWGEAPLPVWGEHERA